MRVNISKQMKPETVSAVNTYSVCSVCSVGRKSLLS